MRGEAFDGEGAGDAHLAVVDIGLVVEEFEIGLGGDGGVDLLLAGDAGFPPLGMGLPGRVGPAGFGVAGDFPFFPLFLERLVELFAERLEFLLPVFPNNIDFGVVGDGLEGDVRHALIDESETQIAMSRLRRHGIMGDFGFLLLPVAGIGEHIIGIARAHDARTRQRQGDAGGVDGYPAAAPLFGDVGGCTAAAGGIENKIAGVSCHQDASLNNR